MSRKKNPVIGVSNLKGGVGKSILAVHLAYILGAELLDLDPQGDSADWAKRSGLVKAHHVHGKQEVFRLLETMKAPVVLDTPPAEGENLRIALAVADVLVIPVKPGSSDLRALGRMRQLIEEARTVNPRLKVGLVLNEAKTGAVMSRQVEDALEALKGVRYLGHLGDRVAFPEAIAAGEVVSGSTAADEIMALAENLMDLTKE